VLQHIYLVLQHYLLVQAFSPEVLSMNTLLVINSSPRSNSVSRRLTRHFAEEWKGKNPGTRVIERDLAAVSLPFVTEPWIQASYTSPAQRTPQRVQGAGTFRCAHRGTDGG
jgi:FMN-dependent NADH-azoreductase